MILGIGFRGARGADDDSLVIGAVIDIPALIAWVERAASRRRSVKPAAANGGGPQGQALQTDGGEQTIELAIGQRGTISAAAPPALRDEASCSSSLCASSKPPTLILIDATAMRIARHKRCRCLPIPGILLGVLAGGLCRAVPDRRSVVAITPCRYRKAGTAPIPTWQFASAPCPTPCRSTNAGASSHPGGIASTASA